MTIDLYKNVRKLKTPEVCEILGISYKTLYRYDKAGILKARRTPTNRRFYLESDIEEFINSSM